MSKLHIHIDAVADIRSIKQQRRAAAERIAVILQEISSDADLIDFLNVKGYCPVSGAYDVDTIASQQRRGKNLYRLKVFDVDGGALSYRVVYAFVPRTGDFHVLGVVPRSFDYAPNNKYTIRMLSAYELL